MKRSRWQVPVGLIFLAVATLFLFSNAIKSPDLVGPDLIKISRPVTRAEVELRQFLPRPQIEAPSQRLLLSSPQIQQLSSSQRLEYAGEEGKGYHLNLVDVPTGKSKLLKQWKPGFQPQTLYLSPNRKYLLFKDVQKSTTHEEVWVSFSLQGSPSEKYSRLTREAGGSNQPARWLADSQHWTIWKTWYAPSEGIIRLDYDIVGGLFMIDVEDGRPHHVLDLPQPWKYPISLGGESDGNVRAVISPSGATEYALTLEEDSEGIGARLHLSSLSPGNGKRQRWFKEGAKLPLILSTAPEYEEIKEKRDINIPPSTQEAIVRLSPSGRYLAWSVSSPSNQRSFSKAPHPPVISLWVTDLQTGKNTLLGIGKGLSPYVGLLTFFWSQDGTELLWLNPASSPNSQDEQWFSLPLPTLNS